MRRSTWLCLAAAALLSCGPRQPGARAPKTVARAKLAPPPPPPPGSAVVYGPLTLESIDVARSTIRWTRDFVRGERTVVYEVVLAQDRTTCPLTALETAEKFKDEEACPGVTGALPASCAAPTKLRARTEITVTHALVVDHRCAGNTEAYPVPLADDPRTTLATAGRGCFKARNKLKPESQWTSLYELTELRIVETAAGVATPVPRLLGALLGEGKDGKKRSPRACRDDGAYLDGAPGAPLPSPSAPDSPLLATLVGRVPKSAVDAPLSTTFRTEHALWETCNAPSVKGDVPAQERCLLLRQLDRFLREVEDQARPETAKGGP